MAHVHLSFAFVWKSLAGLGAIGLLYSQPYRPVAIVGKSMEPTYHDGAFEWTTPVKISELQHGDVVVINNDRGTIVKRIAMLPGDKFLQVKSGNSWLDMRAIKPNLKLKKSRNIFREARVPDNCVYVLGDNGQVSLDSRTFGYVTTDQIQSKLLDQRPNESAIGAE